MSNQWTLPPSLNSYFFEPETQTATNFLLRNAKTDKWKEFGEYAKAMKAARIIQCDYFVFMWELWNASWGKIKLGENSGVRKPKPDGEAKEHTPDKVWHNSYIARNYYMARDLDIYCCVNDNDNGTFGWSIYIYDEKEESIAEGRFKKIEDKLGNKWRLAKNGDAIKLSSTIKTSAFKDGWPELTDIQETLKEIMSLLPDK